MRSLITCLLFLAFSGLAFSQEMKTSFSDKMKLTQKKTGFLDEVIGETERYIFVDYKTYNKRGRLWLERIGVIDKESMKEVNSIKIVDPKDKVRSAEIGDRVKVYERFVGDKIFVFYKEETKLDVKMFAECYSVSLDRIIGMKELVSFPKDSKREFVFPAVSINENEILVSRFDNKDNAIDFIYKVFDLDLNQVIDNTVTLPNPDGAEDGNVFSVNDFNFSKTGMVYFHQSLSIRSGKKRNSLFMRADAVKLEYYLTMLNLETGDLNMLDQNVPNKSMYNVRLVEENNQVNLVGFFCDFEKDPDGLRTHGFFFQKVDEKNLTATEPTFSYFDQKLLDELFKEDTEDKLKTASKKKNKEENQERDKDALSRAFRIEKVRTDANGNLILFCSKMFNYSYQVCSTNSNGGTTCRTVYVCEKGNVTVFKITSEGEFVWSSNLDRYKSYSGWNIYDLEVIEDDDNYYVSFGNSKTEVTEGKKKSKKEVIGYFEYGIFNKSTGDVSRDKIVINEQGAPKSEKKYISAKDVRVYNNQFYLVSSITKPANWIYFTCVCPPAFVISLLTKASSFQEVYIGRIQLDN